MTPVKLPSGQQLAAMDRDDLADLLVEVARDSRLCLGQADFVSPLRYLERLQEASRLAEGVNLPMLEVASAFLKAITRSGFGRRELALRRCFADEPEEAGALFDRVSEVHSLSERELSIMPDAVRSMVERLVEAGILRRTSGAVDVAPDCRRLVQELIDPLVFRLWREVENARSSIALNRLNREDSAAFLSGQFGVSNEQARSYLRRNPVVSFSEQGAPVAQVRSFYRRPPVVRQWPSARPEGSATIDTESRTAQVAAPSATSIDDVLGNLSGAPEIVERDVLRQ